MVSQEAIKKAIERAMAEHGYYPALEQSKYNTKEKEKK